MSNWKEANDTREAEESARLERFYSPEAAAEREAGYDRLCPNWREVRDATSFLIKRGSLSGDIALRYLERRPYDGAWTWDAGMTAEHASRFTLDGAWAMLHRLDDMGLLDAVIVPNTRDRDDPNVTTEQVGLGEMAFTV